MKIGNRDFATTGHTYVMGILNITPDSFSDGGAYHTVDEALYRVEQMISEGMDVLDIGGESTRPGYTQVSDEEEIERVIPVVEKVKSRFDIAISLDTYKSKVASAGITAGADMINDIWGLKYDPRMAGVIAQAKTACCLMHNRKEAVYENYMGEVLRDLGETIDIAHEAGISDDRIILDPGVGFGKSYEQNLEVIDRLESLHSLGYPVLLGASRKSVVGLTLDLPVQQRLEGTIVTTVYAVQKGAMFVRVHDVKENVRAIRMTEAIRDGYRM
ncbi:MAG: dihydropteroate synthase [Lachnospiraceae bacterium]|nr:dihydropteroate synthase [Lachnospiraceae bacterium]